VQFHDGSAPILDTESRQPVNLSSVTGLARDKVVPYLLRFKKNVKPTDASNLIGLISRAPKGIIAGRKEGRKAHGARNRKK
jgi:hypothetical protein